jgi:hypothetical protein
MHFSRKVTNRALYSQLEIHIFVSIHLCQQLIANNTNIVQLLHVIVN